VNSFDPVVDQVINLIEEQLSKVHQRIDALMLVGGFAGSEYLKQRVEVGVCVDADKPNI